MGYQFDLGAVLTAEHAGWLARGLLLTFQLAACAWLLAAGWGLVLTVLRMTSSRIAQAFVAAFVEVHQNIPLLVQMLFWYFAVPELLPQSVRIWINESDSEFILATLAIGMCFSAYVSEALRSGIRAIPRAQYEAGRALGFGFLATFRLIIAPQAARIALPPLVNYTLLLFKNTSIAAAIGVHELTSEARRIESATFRTFEIFLVATVLYLAMSAIILLIGRLLEERMRRNAGGRG